MRQHYEDAAPAEIYGCVYDGDLQTDDLEEIFAILNIEHPDDYKGHSLSVSDIVELEDDNGKCRFSTAMYGGSKRCAFKKNRPN